MEMSTGELNKLEYQFILKMTDSNLEKLQKEHEKQIEKLEKQISRLLEEIRIMEKYNNYEQDN